MPEIHKEESLFEQRYSFFLEDKKEIFTNKLKTYLIDSQINTNIF